MGRSHTLQPPGCGDYGAWYGEERDGAFGKLRADIDAKATFGTVAQRLLGYGVAITNQAYSEKPYLRSVRNHALNLSYLPK